MLKIHQAAQQDRFTGFAAISINGVEAYPYRVRVSAIPFNIWWRGHQRPFEQTEYAAVISFESDEEVVVRVRFSDRTLTEKSDIVIRPLSKKVGCSADGGELTFTLKQHGAYTLEADGFHRALHIFFNPVRGFLSEAKAERTQGNILHYPAGEHNIGNVELNDHTTVVIDAGAVVYGSFRAVCANDIRICGYGIIDGSREERTSNDDPLLYDLDGKHYKDRHTILEDCRSKRVLNGCIRFYCCENVVVEGVTMRDSSTFAFIPAACNNVTADNVKTIGMWRYNSDGIDLFNCSNVIIRNCFLRDFDDCIVIKGIKGWDYKNNENILVENCTVWCDWGRALEYGAETNAPEYRNIIMRNCDIIHGSAVNIDIQHHNNAEIHNCLFDDIRVEYSKYQLPEELDENDEKVYTGRENTRQPALIGIPIVNSGLFSKENIHGCVHDIVFRNISVTADKEVVLPRSFFYGIDSEHTVTDIILENITFNGERITCLDEGNISANEYSKNIVIR